MCPTCDGTPSAPPVNPYTIWATEGLPGIRYFTARFDIFDMVLSLTFFTYQINHAMPPF